MKRPTPNIQYPTSNVVVRALVVVGVMFFNACSRPQDEAIALLKGVDTAALRMDAARIYKQLHSSPGPEFTVIKSPQWPATFKQLKPLRVGCYRDGFSLVLKREGSRETGIHVQPTGMDKQPHGAVTKYEKLEAGIYWYQTQD